MQDLQRQVPPTSKQTNQTYYALCLSITQESVSIHQVKELEQILRHRNPNSLPALIYAAASAAAEEDVDTEKSPNRIVALLEARIQRLESQLESHDEEAKRSLRAMEQRFHSVKVQLI